MQKGVFVIRFFCRYESPCTFSGLQSKERGRGRYEPSRLGLLRTLQVGLPFTRAGTARVAERPRATSPISHSPQHTSSHDSRSSSVGTMPSILKSPLSRISNFLFQIKVCLFFPVKIVLSFQLFSACSCLRYSVDLTEKLNQKQKRKQTPFCKLASLTRIFLCKN